MINKTKISISNDETRHYLSGIFLHKTKVGENNFLTAAATDSHRMSISNFSLEPNINFEPIILPKKTIFILSSLLENVSSDVIISNDKTKIKFQFDNSVLISKAIDGKFPNYNQVIPKNNEKVLKVDLNDFTNIGRPHCRILTCQDFPLIPIRLEIVAISCPAMEQIWSKSALA